MTRDVSQLKIYCRSLYEFYLAGYKWKSVVILNDSWVYLNVSNKRRGKKMSKHASENVKKFSMQASWLWQVSLNWEIKNKKSGKKYEIQPIILSGEIFRSDIYRWNHVSSSQRPSKTETHREKITSRTLSTTIAFLEKIKIGTGIQFSTYACEVTWFLT